MSKKAKLIFKHNYYEIVEEGDCFVRSIRKRNKITKFELLECRMREAYLSPIEVNERFKIKKITLLQRLCVQSTDKDF